MFADALTQARAEAGLSVAHLAELTHTSRAAISDYEAGRKLPRVDTAARILAELGEQYVAVRSDTKARAHISRDVLKPLEAWAPDRDRVLRAAHRDLATIIDADAAIERLETTWGQVKTLVDGTTVDGDPLSIWRLQELTTDARTMLGTIERGVEPRLRIIAEDTLVVANDELASVPRRAMDFLARAIEQGADPAKVRHLVGAYLAHHGYPWLWVPHQQAEAYRRALVVCRRQGDGTGVVRAMIASLDRID